MYRFRMMLGLLSAFFAVASAQAADKELLDILLGNGAIDQSQYDTLLAKQEITTQDVEGAVVKLDKKGFNVASRDGDYSIKVGTRLHFNAASHDGDLPSGVEASNGTELRRARLELKGKFYQDWIWAAEADFADNNASVRDFWLGYQGLENTKIYLGNQKQPYSLAVEMSSNDIPFIERSVATDILIPFTDRAIGVRVEHTGSNWFAAVGLFGEGVNPNKLDDEGWGASGRFVYAPIIEDNQTLHLGVRGALRSSSPAVESFLIRSETTHHSNLFVVNTGVITNADSASILGAEAAYVWDRFSVQGEYTAVSLDRDNLSDLDFESWSVFGTWSLTGESRARAYKLSSGEFKRLTPTVNFNPRERTWGAWELAMRLAHIDLNDGDFIGGDETVMTSSLNWYLNTNVRMMLEWSRILDTDESSPLREDADGLNIFQFRSQYTF